MSYCKHGTYVGGPSGPDYICGACEDGANYPYSYIVKAWLKQEVDGGWSVIDVVETYPDDLIDRLAGLTETSQGRPCKIGWVLKHGWDYEPADLEDTVFDAINMARQEMTEYAVVRLDGSFVIMTLMNVQVGHHDVEVIVRPSGEASWLNENRMITRLEGGQ